MSLITPRRALIGAATAGIVLASQPSLIASPALILPPAVAEQLERRGVVEPHRRMPDIENVMAMLMMAKMSGMLSGGSEAGLSVSDVFATSLWTGNASNRSIVTGTDLAGRGGVVWTKSRSTANGSRIFDTLSTIGNYLDSSAQNGFGSSGTAITAYNSNGFDLGISSLINTNTTTYVGWSFCRAAKFFDVQAVAHVTGTPTVVDFSALGTIGMAALKRTDSTSNWIVKHIYDPTRGLTLNSNVADFAQGNYTIGTSTFTIASGIASGNYNVMAWAHDAAADGLVQCGSFTTNGSGLASVNLGWQPQFALHKRSDAVDDWIIADSARGTNTSTTNALFPNLVAAENTSEPIRLGFTSSGFDVNGSNSATSIYLAIRAP